MEDNNIWLRIKAAEIAAQTFNCLLPDNRHWNEPFKSFVDFSESIYNFIKGERKEIEVKRSPKTWV